MSALSKGTSTGGKKLNLIQGIGVDDYTHRDEFELAEGTPH